MELQGKVIAQTEKRSGATARGEWVAQDFVSETHEQYPHKMVFSVFGEDRLQRFNIQIGQEVNVSFDIDAREYNGRWFNSIRAFDVRQVMPGAAQPAAGIDPLSGAPFAADMSAPAPATSAPATSAPAAQAEESTDDLPFSVNSGRPSVATTMIAKRTPVSTRRIAPHARRQAPNYKIQRQPMLFHEYGLALNVL